MPHKEANPDALDLCLKVLSVARGTLSGREIGKVSILVDGRVLGMWFWTCGVDSPSFLELSRETEDMKGDLIGVCSEDLEEVVEELISEERG